MEPDELLVAEAEWLAAMEYYQACIEDVRQLGE